jgi:chromosome segregation ATPase
MSHALKRKLVAALSTALHPTTSKDEVESAIGRGRALLAGYNQSLADLMDTGAAPSQGSAQVQALTDQIMSLRAREARLCEDLHRANTLVQQQAQQVEETKKFMASMAEIETKFNQIADQCDHLASRLRQAEEDLRVARVREARALAMAARVLPEAA